ncbi:MAG: pantoate--beta-alanine ligase [Muribaculum sp.]|nr:pantoate--beta-alanine ligase [Muribaculum sp.]
MKIIRTVKDLKDYAENLASEKKRTGLVPTMGALHAGHISLVKKAVNDNDAVIVSVFVNPTQFNNPTDLQTYPRNEDADFNLLEEAGVDAVFAPSAEEIYPEGEKAASNHVFDLGEVAEVMEGKFRPGHFQGVAQIVSRLLRWVNPDKAYFGEKDFQQIAVIRRMIATEGIDVEIVQCPIVREPDGLALSSRNARLTKEQRNIAPGIHASLAASVDLMKLMTPAQVITFVTECINALPQCKVEYLSIVDGITLQDVDNWSDSDYIVGCITVYCGDVRLIDNITYKSQSRC